MSEYDLKIKIQEALERLKRQEIINLQTEQQLQKEREITESRKKEEIRLAQNHEASKRRSEYDKALKKLHIAEKLAFVKDRYWHEGEIKQQHLGFNSSETSDGESSYVSYNSCVINGLGLSHEYQLLKRYGHSFDKPFGLWHNLPNYRPYLFKESLENRHLEAIKASRYREDEHRTSTFLAVLPVFDKDGRLSLNILDVFYGMEEPSFESYHRGATTTSTLINPDNFEAGNLVDLAFAVSVQGREQRREFPEDIRFEKAMLLRISRRNIVGKILGL